MDQSAIRDIAVFFAQLRAGAKVILDALVPWVAVIQRFRNAYDEERKRLIER